MKQGKCINCHVRWVSDKDMGKAGKAKCPSCGMILRTTSFQLLWPIRINPNASEKYKIQIIENIENVEKVYPGYDYQNNTFEEARKQEYETAYNL